MYMSKSELHILWRNKRNEKASQSAGFETGCVRVVLTLASGGCADDGAVLHHRDGGRRREGLLVDRREHKQELFI